MIEIKKGIDLPLEGKPLELIDTTKKVTKLALLGSDYVGMKPTMLVKVGDVVKRGEPLFANKTNSAIVFTAPAAGIVEEVHRGAKRSFQSLVLNLTSDNNQVNFKHFQLKKIEQYNREQVTNLLLESGLWTAIRRRPFSTTPAPTEKPSSIFITLLDTNPLAFDPEFIVKQRFDDFQAGLDAIAKLTDGKIHIGVSAQSKLYLAHPRVQVTKYQGIHPAGNVGTHIHFVDSVYRGKVVWHIGFQDILAIGKLFLTGDLDSTRYVGLGGPKVVKPRIIKTIVGASIDELILGEYSHEFARVISGSVFNGHKAVGAFNFLGRFHNQISVVEEHHQRELLGWARPGADRFSVTKVFLSSLLPKRFIKLTTALYGSHRDMVPIGTYEKVMPLDILPTQLLRALLTKDTDLAQSLGVLELDEEDLALCTFVDPGKVDYGPLLRESLATIEKEG